MRRSSGRKRGWWSGPPEKSQNKGSLSNTGLDPLKNHKAIKPKINIGPSMAAIKTPLKIAFNW